MYFLLVYYMKLTFQLANTTELFGLSAPGLCKLPSKFYLQKNFVKNIFSKGYKILSLWLLIKKIVKTCVIGSELPSLFLETSVATVLVFLITSCDFIIKVIKALIVC